MRSNLMIGIVLLAGLVSLAQSRDGFCQDREDGSYGVGCVSEFVSCKSHISTVMKCRRGLYYDDIKNKCIPKWVASSCSGTAPPSGQQPSFEPVQPEQSQFCENRADGTYTVGCVSMYIVCSGQKTYAMECSAGLVYDSVSGECLAKAYVAICGGQPTTTTTQPTTTTTIAIDIPTTELPPTCLPQYKPGFCCTGKPDGYYSLGCSSVYTSCIRGRAYIHKCGASYRFDIVTRRCVAKWYVRECGGHPSTLPATTLPTTTQPPITLPSTFTTPAFEPTSQVITTTPDYCHGHPDGAYSIGCSASYFVCISRKAIFNRCSGGMVFDTTVKVCRYKWFVTACGGTHPTLPPVTFTPITNPASEPSSTHPPVTFTPITNPASEPTSTRPPTVKPPCTTYNGFYAIGCSSRFYSCFNGHPTYHSCPSGLVFSKSTFTCVKKWYVKECVPHTLPPVTYPTTPSTPTPETTPAFEPTTSGVPSAPHYCSGFPDGGYSIGCSSSYFICIHGKPIFNKCSTPFVFDADVQQCRPRWYTRVCGGTPPPASEPPVTLPVTEPTTTMPPQQPTLPPVKPCSYQNGFFGMGCSPRFYACRHGRPTFYDCGHGRVFNQSKLKCMPAREMKKCGTVGASL